MKEFLAEICDHLEGISAAFLQGNDKLALFLLGKVITKVSLKYEELEKNTKINEANKGCLESYPNFGEHEILQKFTVHESSPLDDLTKCFQLNRSHKDLDGVKTI